MRLKTRVIILAGAATLLGGGSLAAQTEDTTQLRKMFINRESVEAPPCATPIIAGTTPVDTTSTELAEADTSTTASTTAAAAPAVVALDSPSTVVATEQSEVPAPTVVMVPASEGDPSQTTELLMQNTTAVERPKNPNSFDRGINKRVFVPKGQWLFGGNVSYQDYSMDDYKLLIMENVEGNGYTFKVSPFLGYFIADNIAVGGRFAYKRTLIKLDNLDLNLSDDLSFSVSDFYNLQHLYSGSLLARTYMNIGESKRFGLFNEVQLTVAGGQGKMISGSGETLTGTYQTITEVGLGLAPGLAAFVTNEVAVEVSVGVLGVNYKKVHQVTDQIYEGNFTRSSADFKIDLFSINLGIAFYMPIKSPIKFNSKKRREAERSAELKSSSKGPFTTYSPVTQ